MAEKLDHKEVVSIEDTLKNRDEYQSGVDKFAGGKRYPNSW